MSVCLANNEHILISFRYSVKNKKYTIDSKTRAKDKCNEVTEVLFKRLEEISQTTWENLMNKPKEVGYEMISIGSLDINMDSLKKELNLSDDSKVIVFRFGKQQKYRLLGVKSKECAFMMYVVGYDWNYNAYNHGS